MKSRVLALTLMVIFTVCGIASSAAERTIVDSMDFQGDVIELTLEKAVEIALKDNAAMKKVDVNYDKAMIDAQSFRDTAREKRKASSGNYDGTTSSSLLAKSADLSNIYTEENAQRTLEAAQITLKAKIEQSYFNLLNTMQVNQITRENLDISKDLYEKTKKKYELGLIAKQELLTSELTYIKDQNILSDSDNKLKAAKMAFNIELGYDVMAGVIVKESPKYNDYKLPGIAESIKRAFDNRMELKTDQYNVDVSTLNLDAEEKSSGKTSKSYRTLRLKLEQAIKDLENNHKTVEVEVRKNYMDVIQKKEAIKSAQKSVELAEEALKLNRSKYDVGMAVLTDVQTSQSKMLQSKVDFSKAILDYNLSVRTFEDSIGLGRVTL